MQGEDAALPLIVPGKDYNQPINFDKDTPLEDALKWGKKKAALKFIECGADVSKPDKEGVTPLRTAAGCGHTEIALLLLKKGADPNDGGKPDYTPLDAASQNNRTDIIEALLAAGAKLEKPAGGERTPLMWAASLDRGEGEAVKLLLKNHAAIDTADKEGNTALTCAVMGQNEKSLQALIDAGAAPDLRNKKGETALYIACNYIHGAANAAQLLRAGADPNLADNEGVTPLMWATVGNLHRETLDALRARRAAVDARDNSGQTALMWAVGNNRLEAVQKLLNAGADPTLRNINGATALDYALAPPGREQGPRDPAIAELLRTVLPAWTQRRQQEAETTLERSTVLQSDIHLSHALRFRPKAPSPGA